MDKPKRDDIIEVSIEDIGAEGNGIGRLNGEFVVFVPQTVPGDIVKAKVKRTKKNYSECGLIEIISPSGKRVKPECGYFGVCNGCKMQHIDYAYQLELKKTNVQNAFERIGGFQGLAVPDALGAGNIYYYRNKLEFSFSNDRWLTAEDMNKENIDKSFALGYHIPGFIDKIIDINDCRLQSEVSVKILNLTREFFKSRNTSVYSTKTHTGYLRFLVIRQSANTPDLMVNLITHTENNELINEFSELLKNSIPEVTTFINSISETKAQVAYAEKYYVISGSGFIEEKIGNYRYKITPNSFFQTNSRQCETLFDKITELGDFKQNENVLDLYCGCGAISLFISGLVNSVYGVELNEGSIESARVNAGLNGVKNCEFESKDVKDYLAELKNTDKTFDAFILDPPRSGIHPKAAEYILTCRPGKIIYVSCNPATQARDTALLQEQYNITKIQPVDMFPHTFHTENVIRLDLK